MKRTLITLFTMLLVLASYYIAFLAFTSIESVSGIEIYTSEVNSGQIAILFLGISSWLFILAAEPFLQTKEFDGFNVFESVQYF